jgi:hypothetical protein
MSVRETHIDITPDKSLMPKMAQAGYSFVQAISELVDNSIDARIVDEKLVVKILLKKDSIEVMDDGEGMSDKAAAACLKLAHSEKIGKLGEFGLGLKTACLSMGKRFVIFTTTKTDSEKYLLEFDEDTWMGSDDIDWSHFPIKALNKDKPMSHGTTVKIDRLKVKTLGRTTNLRESLATRFAPFTTSGEVEITVNTKKCKPKEPLLTEDGKSEFEFDVMNMKIHGWHGLLREGSQRGLYGFNTFRRGRLITTFDKIGFDEHPTVARIVGEIHMDDVPVTNDKREWMKESLEYVEVEKALREHFKDLVKKARAKASDEQVTKGVREKTDNWLDKISQAVKLPEIRNYAKPNVEIGVATDAPTGDPEAPEKILEVEQRDEGDQEGSVEPVGTDRLRTPEKTHERITHVIEIKGKKFKFSHEFKPLGASASWKEHNVDETKGIEVFTNTEFPAFMATNDKPYYAAYHVAESLAEVLIKENGEPIENVDDLKQLILRRASDLLTQIYAAD